MSEPKEAKAVAALIQVGLLVVAGVGVLCAVLHAFFPDRFDEKTAMFLAVAVVALVIHQITKFKGFGIEIEKEVQRLRKEVKGVEDAVGGLEKELGPGSKSAAPAPVGAEPKEARAAKAAVDPNDPNKRQFGSVSEANGRKLTATIKPLAGPKSARCQVKIRIESTDPARPLTGTVKVHLHPSFGDWSSYDLDVRGGVASDEFVSYGAFTIGVVADDGHTPLELDLVDVTGGTERFYKQ